MWVFIWRRASPIGRASPLCRDPASQLNYLTKFVFVYMRGGPAFSPRRADSPAKRSFPHPRGSLPPYWGVDLLIGCLHGGGPGLFGRASPSKKAGFPSRLHGKRLSHLG